MGQEPFEPPPAYASPPDAGAAAQGDLRGADMGGQPSAPNLNVPVAQPIVAQPAQYGGQAQQQVQYVQVQNGQAYPAGAQVIVVQAQPQQNDPGTCALVCFILGFFFYFPWFGCYCADGGLCSENKNAKCWNILSCVFLTTVVVWIIIVFAIFGGWAEYTVYRYDSTKSIISSDCYTSVIGMSGAHGAGYCDDAHCDTCGYGSYAKGDCISCVKGYEIDVVYGDCTGRCVVKGTASNPLSTYSCSPTAQCAYDQMIAD